MKKRNYLATLAALFLVASNAHAYIGPGAGLSAIGSLIALALAIIIALVGFVWFPLKRIRDARKNNAQDSDKQNNELEDDFANRK